MNRVKTRAWPYIRLVARGSGDQQVAALHPNSSAPLQELAARLNEDGNDIVLGAAPSAPDNFWIFTPRFKLRCSADKYSDDSLCIWNAHFNDRWNPKAAGNADIRICWSADRESAPCGRTDLLGLVQAKKALGAGAEYFWDYWGEFLDAERGRIDEVKNHPGWKFQSRRWGADGASFDFEVGDCQDEILITCRTRVLVTMASGDVPFELTKPSGPRWIAAAPVLSQLPLQDVPTSGRLKPDWLSLLTEFRRRSNAFQRLKRGETALPGLNRILPDGACCPYADAPLPLKPILRSNYNQQQQSAIKKALRPGEITVILGPPGTGKTSVIAEIASQVAGGGARALISAQTNLAVDNALEKVLEDEAGEIFRVRLGRPDSVKFNKELLLAGAAERYRRRLLQNSAAASEKEKLALSSANKLPTGRVIIELLAKINDLASRRAEIESLSGVAANAAEEFNQNSARASADDLRLEAVLQEAGLPRGQLAEFLELAQKILRRGWNPVEIAAAEVELRSALRCREWIRELQNLQAICKEKIKQETAGQNELSQTNARISESRALEAELAKAREHNREIDAKRAGAGFLKRLGSWIFDDIKDTRPIEAKITVLDRSGAEAKAPLIAAGIARIRVEAESAARRICEGMRNIGVDFAGGPDSVLVALDAALPRKLWALAAAEFLETAPSRFLFVPRLKAWTVIGGAANEAIESAAAKDRSAGDLKETRIRLSTAQKGYPDDAADYFERIRSLAGLLDISVPDGFDLLNAAATLAFTERVSQAVDDLTIRQERWEGLEVALKAYHERLAAKNLKLEKAVLREANVIAATCSGIAGSKEFDEEFDYVIIDEAGRATPLDLLMPMVRGKTIVIVGDHKQLPPYLDEGLKAEIGPPQPDSESLFQRLFAGSPGQCKEGLSLQYRMAPHICEVVSEISYSPDQPLHTSGEALTRRHTFPRRGAIHWIKCEGKANHAVAGKTGGYRNDAEVRAVVKEALEIDTYLRQRQLGRVYDLGIMAMYREQLLALQDGLAGNLTNSEWLNVELGTVDSFQGREKDAIIVSFAATDPERRYFFLDRRRLNVAISRARELLVIVGAIDRLSGCKPINQQPNPVAELHELLNEGALSGALTRACYVAN